MWGFKSDKTAADSVEYVDSAPLTPDISGSSSPPGKASQGFSAPPPPLTVSSTRVSSNSATSGHTQGNDDAYDRELSRYPESVPDTPSIYTSGFDRLLSGTWIENPRARACYSNVKLGVKMGGLVGGIFGALAGTVYAVQARQILVLPATMFICKCTLII